MKSKLFLVISIAVLLVLALTTVAMANINRTPRLDSQEVNLVETVRQATERYKDVENAEADGHGMFLGCVSGREEGAMGVHYPNGDLVADGVLDAERPEVLIYEVKNGKYALVGVEYLVLADDWDASNDSPPVLMGQVFHRSGSPNRYGLPSFYELHVWAWKTNPRGVFADFNPQVTCEEFN
jgi:hypothetical protein